MIRQRAAAGTLHRRKISSGITLIEVLVAAVLTAVLLGALSYAYVAGLDLQRLQAQRRAETDRTEAFENRITELLRGAKITANTDDATTFFQGQTTGDTGGDLGCDRLTFSTVAQAVPLAALSSEDDFETQQQARGHQGGVAEVSLGLTAVGQPTNDAATGLFERMQRPSDGDLTQGGTETLIAPGLREIGFQFWDGTQWVSSWDTVVGERRLPTAVKVSYVMDSGSGDSNGQDNRRSSGDSEVRSFTVSIPASDVDEQHPASAETTSNNAPGSSTPGT